MPCINASLAVALAVATIAAYPAAAAAAGDEAAPAGHGAVVVGWQHRHAKFSYVGITTLYACDGLESQVRRILLYLGARDDLKVTTGNCSVGADLPSHNAWVDVDFSVPEPTNDRSIANETTAQWTPVELTPRHPGFMSRDDCELLEDMKDLVLKSFMLRSVVYTTSCLPHQLTDNGFAVRGETLKVTASAP